MFTFGRQTAPPLASGNLADFPAAQSALEQRGPSLVAATDQGPKRSRMAIMGIATAMKVLAALGFVVAAAVGGIVANYYEFSTRETFVVASLLGIFGASLGAIIPPLSKAIGWILLAAGVAIIGIGSLRLLGLLVPEFLEQVLG